MLTVSHLYYMIIIHCSLLYGEDGKCGYTGVRMKILTGNYVHIILYIVFFGIVI